MKAIGYLLRLRCTEIGALGVKTAPISRDRHDFRMLAKPFCKTL